MSEEEIKAFCKLLIENRSHEFSAIEKETIKQAIDNAKTLEDLFAVALVANFLREK